MRYSAYILCATPRSGSTFLCDLLSATAAAGDPHSYLRAEDLDDWARDWGVALPVCTKHGRFNPAYVSAMVRAGTAGSGVFGLRLMWRSLATAAGVLGAAGERAVDIGARCEQLFGPTLFIHLSRRDKLAQAVSLVRAEQTGLWHLAADGSERERTAPSQPLVFDPDRLERTRLMLAADDAGWRTFFAEAGIRPLELTYEEIVSEPRRALVDVLTALGVDPANVPTPDLRTARMADSISAEWVQRVASA